MCGIIGYCGSIDNGDLKSGLQALVHRGPDNSGSFVDRSGKVGLAHTRLSILDLSTLGHQPMISYEGSVTIVFNGEIYNYQKLRTELKDKGFDFRGHSDTEVVLNLYLLEGESMLSRLNGIFAFAIWDKRKRSLLLARDGLGVKPLYYSAFEGGFAFASEIKALLHLVPDEKDLDISALHRYLSFLWCPGAGTPLKKVRKLLPGEAMWVRDGKIEHQWGWYQLPAFQSTPAKMDKKRAIDETISHLRQAVHRQMVADVPVGAFLSGGLDSSAIVAFAREINPDIHCFSIEILNGHESGVADDLPYAKKVSKHLGVSLEVVSIDAGRMANDLEQMVVQLDEPLADPAALNVLYICQLARSQGMKVLLSGAGGDDLFTGYRRHRAVNAEKYWQWMPQGVLSKIEQITSDLDQRRTWCRRLGKLFNGAALEGDARLIEYFRWSRETDLFKIYTPEMREALGDEEAGLPMLKFLKKMPASATPLERMLALEQRFFLADHNLIYTDKMSMAAGVEVRVPFLDLDLVQFARQIPMRFKQRGSEGKWILKKAMEPYLPHDVIYRPKSGFGAPLRRWMKNELRELLGDLLSVDSLKRRGLFEPAAVQDLIVANGSGRIDASYTLLSLLCIEIWCRAYLDCNKQWKKS